MALLVSVELKPSGGCHTFGQPRVGNAEFLKVIDFPYYRYRNNNDIVPGVPPSWLFFRHGGVLRYINSYGNIRIASYWQRFKDKWRGLFTAWKNGKFFDSILDHNMGAYHEYISNMDDNGEQLPK